MSRLMNDNANVVNPEHAIDHNSFGGVAYVPVSSPLRSLVDFDCKINISTLRLMKNERWNEKWARANGQTILGTWLFEPAIKCC